VQNLVTSARALRGQFSNGCWWGCDIFPRRQRRVYPESFHGQWRSSSAHGLTAGEHGFGLRIGRKSAGVEYARTPSA
jgi:hypothetical protein